jgi:CXCXC repeat
MTAREGVLGYEGICTSQQRETRPMPDSEHPGCVSSSLQREHAACFEMDVQVLYRNQEYHGKDLPKVFSLETCRCFCSSFVAHTPAKLGLLVSLYNQVDVDLGPDWLIGSLALIAEPRESFMPLDARKAPALCTFAHPSLVFVECNTLPASLFVVSAPPLACSPASIASSPSFELSHQPQQGPSLLLALPEQAPVSPTQAAT